jgi:hypothetical protein
VAGIYVSLCCLCDEIVAAGSLILARTYHGTTRQPTNLRGSSIKLTGIQVEPVLLALLRRSVSLLPRNTRSLAQRFTAAAAATTITTAAAADTTTTTIIIINNNNNNTTTTTTADTATTTNCSNACSEGRVALFWTNLIIVVVVVVVVVTLIITASTWLARGSPRH